MLSLYPKLSPDEKEFILANPIAAIYFKKNADIALDEAKKRFAGQTLLNGAGDAFRHCFWSAMNCWDQGIELARKFGEAHENWTGNPAAQKSMDLYNNEVGYAIGRQSPGASNRHLAVLSVNAWASSKLVQIQASQSTHLIYSNSLESLVY